MEATLVPSAPIHGGRSSLSRHRISMKPHFYSPKPLLRFSASRLLRGTMAVSSTESNPLRAAASGAAASGAAASGAAASGAVVLAALLSAAFRPPLARADPSAPTPPAVKVPADAESDPSVASQLLRSLLFRKLEAEDDSDALATIRHLISAHPDETEWKLLAARLFRETGEVAESRRLYEEILAVDLLSFEALFENAVLLDRCGEGDAAIERLEQELYLAKEEQPEKVARDARLIMAQIEFLQKKPEAALSSYEELAKEDPDDYRPYFCQGVICSLLNRNEEAREKFSKYHELLSLRKLN